MILNHLGDGNRNGICHQTDGVIHRDNREQRAGQFALRAVLTHNEQRRRGRGSRANRPEAERHRHREPEQRNDDIDEYERAERFTDGDDDDLAADCLDVREFKLAADGKRDETKRGSSNHIQRFKRGRIDETEAVRADQKSGD